MNNDDDGPTNVVTGYFGGSPYRDLEELHERIDAVLEEFDGRVSIAGVMGVLEIIKQELYHSAMEEVSFEFDGSA